MVSPFTRPFRHTDFFLSASSAYSLAVFYDPLEGSAGNQTRSIQHWQKMTSGVGVYRLVVNIVMHTCINFSIISLIWILCTLMWWVWARLLQYSNNTGLTSALFAPIVLTPWFTTSLYTPTHTSFANLYWPPNRSCILFSDNTLDIAICMNNSIHASLATSGHLLSGFNFWINI